MIKGFKSETKTLQRYSGEIEIIFSAESHRYQITDRGVKISGTLGVTTVLGILDKPQLLQWAVNMTVESFNESLTPGTVIDESNLIQISKKASLAWREKRDSAGDIGILIHTHIENYIRKRIEYQKKKEKYIPDMPFNSVIQKAFTKFLLWERLNVQSWVATEMVVYSRRHNVAGTLDGLYISNEGALALCDVKTSKGIYKSFYYQVAAYAYMYNEEGQSNNNSTPLKITDMTIVRVGKEDGDIEVKKIIDYEKNAKAFLACVLLKRS